MHEGAARGGDLRRGREGVVDGRALDRRRILIGVGGNVGASDIVGSTTKSESASASVKPSISSAPRPPSGGSTTATDPSNGEEDCVRSTTESSPSGIDIASPTSPPRASTPSERIPPSARGAPKPRPRKKKKTRCETETKIPLRPGTAGTGARSAGAARREAGQPLGAALARPRGREDRARAARGFAARRGVAGGPARTAGTAAADRGGRQGPAFELVGP